jgi:lipid II:glycine glycyltransferase (peptidoglycan interpeptide bridge formation enzyme)
LRIVEAESPDEIRQFAHIYQETMARNNAEERSFFTDEYFLTFRRWLPLNSRFTLTIYQDQAIGALFILFDDEDVYAYRGGSDKAFHHLNPATFQIWDAICWAHRTGRKRVILGGGFAPNDGIYHFKLSFSPLRQPFYIYKKIYRPADYARLEDACRGIYGLGNEPISYFPSYRYVRPVVRASALSLTSHAGAEQLSYAQGDNWNEAAPAPYLS